VQTGGLVAEGGLVTRQALTLCSCAASNKKRLANPSDKSLIGGVLISGHSEE
jgi:hypothetical protein